jgi:hypothetical protein
MYVEVTLPDLTQYIEPPPKQDQTKPVIIYARFMGDGTQALVKAFRSLDTISDLPVQFTATLLQPGTTTPYTRVVDGTEEDMTFEVSTTNPIVEFALTGLDTSLEYDVHITDASDQTSTPVPIIALTWQNSIGHVLLEEVELECGGSRIDRATSEWLEIHSELTTPHEKYDGLNRMIGRFAEPYNPRTDGIRGEQTLIIPLRFFFNLNPSMALPLLGLTFHEVKLNFTLRQFKDCLRSTRREVRSLLDDNQQPLTFKNIKVYANYIYLDAEHRRRYITNSTEQLVTTLQFLGAQNIDEVTTETMTKKFNIDFSHPVKEIVFVYQPYDSYTGNSMTLDWFGWRGTDFFTELRIDINGHQRFSSRGPEFFKLQQVYAHHTRIPTNKNIYVYSFALEPESSQGTGSCNFSRISSSQIICKLRPFTPKGRLLIFAQSFNVFKISQGLGALSFAGN